MTSTILVLGGTGKTGRRLTAELRAAGHTARAAARSGADIRFDWSEPVSFDAALDGVDSVYLVPPALRLDFAADVRGFLDRAETAGVRHVTYLSARGVEHAPPEVSMRAVELDLAARPRLTHTILRPAFFMQNFTEGAFSGQVATGVLALPAGEGGEAFIDAHDIASTAAATLLDPAAHDGRNYELTGPETLTHNHIAALLTEHGHPVRYQAVSVEDWANAATEAGLPPDYAQFLGSLLVGIAEGHGAQPGDAVQQATGRPPTRFAAVLERDTAQASV